MRLFNACLKNAIYEKKIMPKNFSRRVPSDNALSFCVKKISVIFKSSTSGNTDNFYLNLFLNWRAAHRRQLEALQAQIEDNESRNKSETSSAKKKLLAEIEDAKQKYEQLKKSKSDSEAQQKKLQQANKVNLEKD